MQTFYFFAKLLIGFPLKIRGDSHYSRINLGPTSTRKLIDFIRLLKMMFAVKKEFSKLGIHPD